MNLAAQEPAEACRLRGALAEALANAGRGVEAARDTLPPATGRRSPSVLELRRLAAMQFLISGHIDQGLDALRDVLSAIGMTLPRTPGGPWRRSSCGGPCSVFAA